MKHAVTAVIALALGAGLAAAAQAQSTSQQPSITPGTQIQSTAPSSTAPSSTMQSTAPTAKMQSTAPTANMKQSAIPQQQQSLHAKAQKVSKPGQLNIRQAQLKLKSEGLLKGKVTGKMDRQTHLAIARFQKENRLPQTASLNRATTTRLMGTQLARSGASMQKTRMAHATAHLPKAQTTGVGSSMPNAKSTAGAPMTSPATNPTPAGAGGTSSTKPSTAPATPAQPSGSPANK